jgi:putative transposase
MEGKIMPWKSAAKVEVSEKQERILKGYAAGTHSKLHLKTRAQIVLKAANGCTNNSIERDMDLDAKSVKLWRDRYCCRYEELKLIEAETPWKLRNAIVKILSDEQRPGRPSTFTDEHVAAIISLACEDPAKLGLPFSHWTPGLLQIEVKKLSIVKSISVRQIGRFLKRKGLTAS